MPLIEEPHLTGFLQVAATSRKLVHIYVVETTRAAAILKQRKEEAEEYLKYHKACQKFGVVIEEIEEPDLVVPR